MKQPSGKEEMKLTSFTLKSVFRLELMITGFLPVLILSFVVYAFVNTRIKEQALNNLDRFCEKAPGILETSIYRLSSALKHLNLDPASNLPADRKSVFERALKEIRPVLSLEALAVLNSGEEILESTDTPLVAEAMKASGLKEFSSEEVRVSDAFFLSSSDLPLSLICVPLNRKSGVVLLALVKVKTIWDLFQPYLVGDSCRLKIVDSDFRWLAGEGEENLGKDMSPLELKRRLSIRNENTEKEEGLLSSSGFLFKDEYSLSFGASFRFLGGKKGLIRLPGWYVIVLQETREMFAVTEMLQKVLAVLVLVILLMVFLFSRLTRQMVIKPLSLLLELIQKAGKGDYRVRTHMKFSNEIGVIYTHFDTMMEQIQSSRDSLRHEVSEKEKAFFLLKDLNQNLEDRVRERTQEIIHLKQLHESILNSLTSGLFVMNSEKKMVFVNPMARVLLSAGTEPSEHITLDSSLIPSQMRELISFSLKEKKAVDSREIFWEGPGKGKYFGVKTALLSTENKVSHVIVLFNDITDRRNLEHELIQGEKITSCGLLAVGMAHDFNNILNRIKVSVDTILRLCPEGDVAEFAMNSQEAVLEGKSMTHSLMVLGKKEMFTLVPVHLLSSFKIFEEKVSGKGVKESALKIECSDSLTIMAEPIYFQQILFNLYLNAEQASFPDNFKVSLSAFKKGAQCIIQFADNGTGISAETMQHLFEPFYSTKVISEKSGWGMGLAFVKSLVKNMNGRISIASRPGESCVFEMEFPLCITPDAKEKE